MIEINDKLSGVGPGKCQCPPTSSPLLVSSHLPLDEMTDGTLGAILSMFYMPPDPKEDKMMFIVYQLPMGRTRRESS